MLENTAWHNNNGQTLSSCSCLSVLLRMNGAVSWASSRSSWGETSRTICVDFFSWNGAPFLALPRPDTWNISCSLFFPCLCLLFSSTPKPKLFFFFYLDLFLFALTPKMTMQLHAHAVLWLKWIDHTLKTWAGRAALENSHCSCC